MHYINILIAVSLVIFHKNWYTFLSIENTPFISLNDYIASISFDTDEVKCFYPTVGKIPKECIDFTVIDEVLIPKRSFVYSELMILTVALATLSTLDF